MCEKLMKQEQLFQENFLDIMIDLKNDKVVNVKLALAEIVRRHADEKGPMSTHEKFKQLYNALKNDEEE